MKSNITVKAVGDDAPYGTVFTIQCDRSGCDWWHDFDEPISLEAVNEVAADHWSTHMLDDFGRMVREALTAVRVRVDDLVTGFEQGTGPESFDCHQAAPTTRQAPVSQPAETVGDADAAALHERLQAAHTAVWHCPDCGSDTITVVDGQRQCSTCGWEQPIPGPPESDDLALLDLPPADTEPTTGASTGVPVDRPWLAGSPITDPDPEQIESD